MTRKRHYGKSISNSRSNNATVVSELTPTVNLKYSKYFLVQINLVHTEFKGQDLFMIHFDKSLARFLLLAQNISTRDDPEIRGKMLYEPRHEISMISMTSVVSDKPMQPSCKLRKSK